MWLSNCCCALGIPGTVHFGEGICIGCGEWAEFFYISQQELDDADYPDVYPAINNEEILDM